jgi:2-phosphosulfolactate phosphatase
MNIQFCDLESCGSAQGTVVAVDVVRAFTTAAFAFEAGAREIWLVSSVDEALELRARHPGALAMGESGGLPVEGFDLWNSPAQLKGRDLTGKTLVQRTSAGTQGIVRSTGANQLFAASFVIAQATAQAIRQTNPAQVTFVITGEHPDDARYGREDRACAEYIAALLRDETPDPRAYLTWAGTFLEERLADEPEELRQAFAADLDLCVQVNRYTFAMQVRRADGLLVMEKSL